MAITYQTCMDHLRRIFGTGSGGGLPDHIRPMEVVNVAGRELCNAHYWAWLSNVSDTLTIPADTNYVDLPANMKALHAVTLTDTVIGYAVPTTATDIMQKRENTVGTTAWNYLYWAVTPAHTDTGLRWRLQVWPTHSEERTDGLSILYSAGWTEVTTDTQTLTLPPYLEGLYVDMLEAVGKGWDEEDLGLRGQRVAAVLTSPSMENAKTVDGMSAPALGGEQHGAAQVAANGLVPWQHGYAYGGNSGVI